MQILHFPFPFLLFDGLAAEPEPTRWKFRCSPAFTGLQCYVHSRNGTRIEAARELVLWCKFAKIVIKPKMQCKSTFSRPSPRRQFWWWGTESKLGSVSGRQARHCDFWGLQNLFMIHRMIYQTPPDRNSFTSTAAGRSGVETSE
jgi:hypothetical protein